MMNGPVGKRVQTQNGREIWITRGHLAALGTATLFIALLAFFVGIQVGRNQADTPQSSRADALLPDPDREDALEALLREVEAAQSAAPPLAFPEALTEDTPPEVSDGKQNEAVETAVQPAEEAAPEPPPDPPKNAPVPTSGWSVQIASYDNGSDADARVKTLRDRGMKAYRVTALVRGKNWYRVKVGSYPSEKAATAARTDLAAKLGTRDLMVTEAP
jgi:cell division protein FtsN